MNFYNFICVLLILITFLIGFWIIFILINYRFKRNIIIKLLNFNFIFLTNIIYKEFINEFSFSYLSVRSITVYPYPYSNVDGSWYVIPLIYASLVSYPSNNLEYIDPNVGLIPYTTLKIETYQGFWHFVVETKTCPGIAEHINPNRFFESDVYKVYLETYGDSEAFYKELDNMRQKDHQLPSHVIDFLESDLYKLYKETYGDSKAFFEGLDSFKSKKYLKILDVYFKHKIDPKVVSQFFESDLYKVYLETLGDSEAFWERSSSIKPINYYPLQLSEEFKNEINKLYEETGGDSKAFYDGLMLLKQNSAYPYVSEFYEKEVYRIYLATDGNAEDFQERLKFLKYQYFSKTVDFYLNNEIDPREVSQFLESDLYKLYLDKYGNGDFDDFNKKLGLLQQKIDIYNLFIETAGDSEAFYKGLGELKYKEIVRRINSSNFDDGLTPEEFFEGALYKLFLKTLGDSEAFYDGLNKLKQDNYYPNEVYKFFECDVYKVYLETVGDSKAFYDRLSSFKRYQDVLNPTEECNGFDPALIPQQLDKTVGRHLVTDNKIVLPVNTPIKVSVTSIDGIHSLILPSLDIRLDVIPNTTVEKIILIDKPGLYWGICSDITTPSNGYMPVVFEITSYQAFLEQMKDSHV